MRKTKGMVKVESHVPEALQEVTVILADVFDKQLLQQRGSTLCLLCTRSAPSNAQNQRRVPMVLCLV